MPNMAAHQFIVVKLDRVKVALTDQMQRAPAGDLRGIDIFIAFNSSLFAGLRRGERRNYSATFTGFTASTTAFFAATVRATCAARVRLWFLLAVRILGMENPVC
jgi:hypothetical protein